MVDRILYKIARPFFHFMGKYKYHLKENYITANADISWWEKHINNMVLEQYQTILSGVVADFGCNHGACTILAARNPRIKQIVGFDLNSNAIDAAHQLLEKSNEPPEIIEKIRYEATHFNKIEWPSNYFDAAYMFHVLEHIFPKDRGKIFSEIVRVMKHNSGLLITVPFENAYDDGFQHVAFFNEDSLKNTMEKVGFKVVECYRDQRIDEHTPEGHDCLNILCKANKI